MKKILLLFCICLFAACSNLQYVENSQAIKLDEAGDKALGFSDVFSPVSVVLLETNAKCLLKNIRKVEQYNGKYYVLGEAEDYSVFVFDKDGKFCYSIGRKGHGKGEYVNANDFTIDWENNRIVILSAPSKVYVYDIEGNFKESKKISKSMIWNICSSPSGFIGVSNHLTFTEGKDAYLIYEFDKNFNLKQKQVPVLPNQIYSPSTLSSVFQQAGDDLYYVDSFSRKVYDVNKGEEDCLVYALDMLNPMPIKKFEKPQDFLENQHKYDFLMDVIVLKDKILVAYIQNNKYCVEVLDRNGKKIRHGQYRGRFPNLYHASNDVLLMPVSAYSYVKDNMEELLPKTKNKVSAGDNCLIVSCKLKK